MSNDVEAVQLNRITATPDLSFTTVRWVPEIPDPDDEDSVEAVDMFSVVGEQYRLRSVEAAAAAVGNESAFLPPRFWFVPDDENEHDDQAVAVYATVKDFGYHVGFLPKRRVRTPQPWGVRSRWCRSGPDQPVRAMRRRARLTALTSALERRSSWR